MKKFIALAIAVVMLAALAVPAFAAGNFTDSDDQTKVTYTVTETYIVTVPADVALTDTGATGVTVKATTNLFSTNQLKVTTDKTVYTMTAANSEDTADITLSKGEFIFESVATDATDSFDITWTKPNEAGEYSTTITFNAVVEAKPVVES